MNKKTLIFLIVVLAVLAVGIGIAVAKLFSEPKADGELAEEAVVRAYPLLPAVPADAVSLLCTDRLYKAVETLSDSTKVLGALFRGTGNNASFGRFTDSLAAMGGAMPLGRTEAVLSLHNRGDLMPLLIVEAGNLSDNGLSPQALSLKAAAESEGLYTEVLNCTEKAGDSSPLKGKNLLLISPSDNLLTSVLRHVEGRTSVMDKPGFNKAASMAGGEDAIFIANSYLSKQFQSFLMPGYASTSSFFAEISDWIAIAIRESGAERFEGSGYASFGTDPSYFLNVFSASQPGEVKAAEKLPPYTVFAVSLPIGNIKTYIDDYKKYRDAASHLDKYEAANKQFRDSVGVSAEQWAQRLDIKELVKASFRAEDGLESILLIRIGKEDAELILKGTGADALRQYKQKISPYPYAGFTDLIFGKLFGIPEESSSAYNEGWIAVGSEKALEDYIAGMADGKNLAAFLADNGLQSRIPGGDTQFFTYFSVSEFPPLLDRIFRPALAKSFRKTLNGVSFEPLTFSITKKDELMSSSLKVDRIAVPKTGATVVERDTSVVIPEGPFPVKNSSTGKTNYLSQQKTNGYIILSDENHKNVWGIPFDGRLCGNVETIDFYANGRLQFLFCSGSSLYILDRLGRFVKPSPIGLGKEVLLGPKVVDITGENGYRALVVHKDNTIAMYNLHGQRPKEWKDIKADGVVKALPELLDVKGKKYWLVRTSMDANIYGFWGGEARTKLSGSKAIRPDSKIEINEKGTVSATSFDGKVRNIKLEK